MNNQNQKPRIGISACLTGQPVRFDGSHKKSDFCLNTLGNMAELVPLCPEMAVGLPVPRPAIRLVNLGDEEFPEIRAIGSKDKDPHNPELDVTDALNEYGDQIGEKLQDLDGFVFMQKSPSCGVFSAKLYRTNGYSEGTTSGLFAKRFVTAHPDLPVEEAGRLNDAGLRDNFMIRIFTAFGWRQLIASGLTKKKLIQFHSQHKYLVMAHSVVSYRALGRFLADLSSRPFAEIAEEYYVQLMQALSRPAKRKSNANALMHMCGYLKRFISSEDKTELRTLIERYRKGEIPVVVPFTLLQHHLNKHYSESSYIQTQRYLLPYPPEITTRNFV